MTPQPGRSYSEKVLDGRLIIHVYDRPSHGEARRISIGSLKNGAAGSMILTPLELAALLDGPLERALEEAERR